MKQQKIQKLIRTKEAIERGIATPAKVWELRPKDKGGFTRTEIAPKVFQRAQKSAWKRSIPAARRRLGLSQARFAQLLGISVRTLHHWEQGSRRPPGAARVL